MLIALFILSTLILFAALYVALPDSVELYHRFMHGHVVDCPDRHQQSTVIVSPGIAAGSAPIVRPILVVKGCVFWPENRKCRRHCTAQLRCRMS